MPVKNGAVASTSPVSWVAPCAKETLVAREMLGSTHSFIAVEVSVCGKSLLSAAPGAGGPLLVTF